MERNIPIFKTDPMEALVRRIKNDHSSIASSIASSLPYSGMFQLPSNLIVYLMSF